MNKLKIVIPLKTNSERIPNKNLRQFIDDKSLFDIKAEQLRKVFDAKDIYVSSENPEVEKIVKKYGFNFHLRDISLTKSNTKENQLVKTIVESIPNKPDIMWCQVTQPIFNEFGELIRVYQNLEAKYDSIVVVKKARHHILDEKGNPVNFNFGYWHKISQDLPNLYEVTWSAFIMKREMLDQAWYQIGRNPYLYETQQPLVDINDMAEFKMASILYSYYSKMNILR
jgi:N-acylneuraminate cytidylyltransferase